MVDTQQIGLYLLLHRVQKLRIMKGEAFPFLDTLPNALYLLRSQAFKLQIGSSMLRRFLMLQQVPQENLSSVLLGEAFPSENLLQVGP